VSSWTKAVRCAKCSGQTSSAGRPVLARPRRRQRSRLRQPQMRSPDRARRQRHVKRTEGRPGSKRLYRPTGCATRMPSTAAPRCPRYSRRWATATLPPRQATCKPDPTRRAAAPGSGSISSMKNRARESAPGADRSAALCPLHPDSRQTVDGAFDPNQSWAEPRVATQHRDQPPHMRRAFGTDIVSYSVPNYG
jgi:hypothetical protein